MTCKWFDVCPLRRLEKEKKISEKWKKEYCLSKSNYKNCKRFQLEEKGIEHSDNLLPNGEVIE
jgi:hypothetical protein